MKLIDKQTGEAANVSSAGAELLLRRGTHVLPVKDAPKPKKQAAKKDEAGYESGADES